LRYWSTEIKTVKTTSDSKMKKYSGLSAVDTISKIKDISSDENAEFILNTYFDDYFETFYDDSIPHSGEEIVRDFDKGILTYFSYNPEIEVFELNEFDVPGMLLRRVAFMNDTFTSNVYMAYIKEYRSNTSFAADLLKVINNVILKLKENGKNLHRHRVLLKAATLMNDILNRLIHELITLAEPSKTSNSDYCRTFSKRVRNLIDDSKSLQANINYIGAEFNVKLEEKYRIIKDNGDVNIAQLAKLISALLIKTNDIVVSHETIRGYFKEK
jgi:hypothetical protein